MSPGERLLVRWALPATLVLTAILYFAGLDFPFVYDDTKQVLANPAITSWDGLRLAFTETVWHFDELERAGGYWRPVFVAVLTIEYQLFGTDPFGWHLLALAIHLVDVMLVVRVAERLGIGAVAARVGGLLFAVHPVQIEAVIWPSGISDPLACMFGLLALSAWDIAGRADGARRIRALVGCGLAMLAAMLTLERSLAWVLVLGVHTLVLSRAALRRRAIDAIAIAFALLVWWLGRGAVVDGLAPAWLGHAESLATAPAIARAQLEHLLVPVQLALAYPVYPQHESEDSLAFGLLLAIAVVALVAWRSRGDLRLSVLAGAAAVSIVLTLYPRLLASHSLVQDRYLYSAMAFAAPWLATVALARGRLGAMLLGAWTLVLLGLHPGNLRPWRDEASLYARAVESDPEHPQFLMNLSNALRADGERDDECRLLRAAEGALTRHPARGNAALVAYNLGNCWRQLGHPELAIAAYREAVAARGGSFHRAHHNLVIALAESGQLEAARAELAALQQAWPSPETTALCRSLGGICE